MERQHPKIIEKTNTADINNTIKKPNALLNAIIQMTELNNLTNVNPLLHLKIIRKIFKIVRNADFLTLQNLKLASLVNTILKK